MTTRALEALTGTPEADTRRIQRALSGAARDAARYTPADAADWTGTPPATIAEALDRIAAALGPIA